MVTTINKHAARSEPKAHTASVAPWGSGGIRQLRAPHVAANASMMTTKSASKRIRQKACVVGPNDEGRCHNMLDCS